ncbi:DNA helicase UvrD [Candidatus Jorgensenbacteria bacterium CG_4_10_14_0_8_um_filter_39_13]|uniref:DNA helicase UvrD n=2 Tax=Candidatus Joergenseniibacteriota TaxID=1752739 RepID=A0A2M7RGL5_9BACT|nr:MAG: DNA helicase UvrD [Candidatus Jorgensenbacteria bacterium CG11_big_fil_rev_8_21_14_0_20_38_23]PIV13017.1 MAG: DNA helicase UvrD [Candidatus Jorgensenbacteria bacterium CG03_land_8_20_14_0_80_38_39]PIY95844.1 MAG: DNA helicase UvrD [Candidatus Jorgensenbacteria bacterium CG_4_10_14_0_8_um_filter_39_13]
MKFIADLEIHSKYARAVSPQMLLENLALWGAKKGIKVLGTGDFTHPLWLEEIKEKLEPAETGLFKIREKFVIKDKTGVDPLQTRFILSGEISCIYSKNNKVRRVHHLIYAPSIEIVEKINVQLGWVGKLKSDGRPIIGIDSKELLKILLTASPECVLIPAHVWTPYFGVFGSKSGFDSLRECFDELESHIFAIETGLSADPPMCWRIPFLDNKAIISSSDSHSLHRIGREATIFDTDLSYKGIMEAIRARDQRLIGTIEFFPEEGRYHYDGHAGCKIRFSPEETKKHRGLCPVCGKLVTVGVMARIDELAPEDRPIGFKPAWAKPYYSFIPFDEVIAESLNLGVNTKGVWREYEEAIKNFGSEFNILINASEAELKSKLPPVIAEGVIKMRQGRVYIEPGYDGEYGKIKIFEENERENLAAQKSLF